MMTLGRIMVLAFFAGICASRSAVHAQTQFDPRLDETGETTIVRPGACPTEVHGGLFGFIWGYEHAGHAWTDDWQVKQILDPVDHALAKYVPEGDPYSIVSRDGRAEWFAPAFIARCQIFEQWFNGRIVASEIDVRVIENLGTVRECSGGSTGGGGGWGEFQPVSDVYGDEYDPYTGSDDCTTVSTGDGGDGGSGAGSGIPYDPGDYTGGETVDWNTGRGNGGSSVCGLAARVEYICIDKYVDGVGWVEWSCGYATTC